MMLGTPLAANIEKGIRYFIRRGDAR